MEAYTGPFTVIGIVAEVKTALIGPAEVALLVQPGDRVVRARPTGQFGLVTAAQAVLGKLALVTGTASWSSNGRMVAFVAQRIEPYTDAGAIVEFPAAPEGENADTAAPGTETGAVA